METVLSRGGLLALGAVLSAAVAVAGVRARALTRDGAAAAVLVGTLVVGFGGLAAGALLAIFFATSSALTRWGADRKHHPEHRGGRSASQVLANGVVAVAAAVWWGLDPSAHAAAALAGAVAAATADTWATELGTLSLEQPRLITTQAAVPPGTSGAVTWRGTVAGIVGAGLIASGAAAFFDLHASAVWLAGVLGMIVDSILGATAEPRVSWMTNDAVNLLGTLSGALVAALIVAFL